jgi:hypothetical protein
VTDRPCGSASCPVPERPPAHLRSTVWQAGRRLHRGHKNAYPADELVPGGGATRFAPQDQSSHVYLATTEIGALLESALHDASPPFPRVQLPTLQQWSASVVELQHDVRLFDLRDPELDRLRIGREQLVSTLPVHYACTRAWASRLVGRSAGGQQTHGLVWHSRQSELHARAMKHRPAFARLLSEHPTEVAVVWSPPAPARLLQPVPGEGIGRLRDGDGWRFVEDLLGLLGIVSDPG